MHQCNAQLLNCEIETFDQHFQRRKENVECDALGVVVTIAMLLPTSKQTNYEKIFRQFK